MSSKKVVCSFLSDELTCYSNLESMSSGFGLAGMGGHSEILVRAQPFVLPQSVSYIAEVGGHPVSRQAPPSLLRFAAQGLLLLSFPVKVGQ